MSVGELIHHLILDFYYRPHSQHYNTACVLGNVIHSKFAHLINTSANSSPTVQQLVHKNCILCMSKFTDKSNCASKLPGHTFLSGICIIALYCVSFSTLASGDSVVINN